GDARRPKSRCASRDGRPGQQPEPDHRARWTTGLSESDPRHARGLLRGPGAPDRRPCGTDLVRFVKRGPVMRSILHVATHVFRDSVRDKVLYSIVVFAVILMVSSFLIGQLTAGQDVKIIKDLGLAAMSLFGLFIAIFIGVGLVSREIERRSIYAVLAKPVRRHEFIVG